MKYLLGILMILGSATLEAEPSGIKNKILLESTFPEGFGILIKKKLLIKKINLTPDSKSGGSEEIYIIVNKDEKERDNREFSG